MLLVKNLSKSRACVKCIHVQAGCALKHSNNFHHHCKSELPNTRPPSGPNQIRPSPTRNPEIWVLAVVQLQITWFNFKVRPSNPMASSSGPTSSLRIMALLMHLWLLHLARIDLIAPLPDKVGLSVLGKTSLLPLKILNLSSHVQSPWSQTNEFSSAFNFSHNVTDSSFASLCSAMVW